MIDNVEQSKLPSKHPVAETVYLDGGPFGNQNGGMIVGCNSVGSGTWRLYDHLVKTTTQGDMTAKQRDDRIVAEVRRWYPSFDPVMPRPGEKEVSPLTSRAYDPNSQEPPR